MGRLAPLLLLFAACAPLQAPPATLPYPGGFAQGGLVTGRFQVALPGTPLFLDAHGNTLYAAYPYQLLVFREGLLESLPLPGIPRFLRANPKLAVGLGEGVFTEAGLLPYPAQDAVLTERGLYWVGRGGLYLEGTLLRQGHFRQVVALEGQVVALGEEALFLPEGRSLPLPSPVRKAQAGTCGVVALLDQLYLVRPDGLKPVAEAQDFATWGETLYLIPGNRTLSCKEVAWP